MKPHTPYLIYLLYPLIESHHHKPKLGSADATPKLGSSPVASECQVHTCFNTHLKAEWTVKPVRGPQLLIQTL